MKKLTSILLLVVILSACAGSSANAPSIEVQGAWVRAPGMVQSSVLQKEMQTPTVEIMPGMSQGMAGPRVGEQPGSFNGAAFMVLRNRGSMPDHLLRVESDIAQVVELYENQMQNEGMSMRLVESVEVPANGQVEFKPGGLYMMLVGVKHTLQVGDQVTLILVFEISGKIIVKATVRAL